MKENELQTEGKYLSVNDQKKEEKGNSVPWRNTWLQGWKRENTR